MSYKKIAFLNDKEIEMINILKDVVSDQYWILNKIRLSEFLYSVKEYGSAGFYDDFKRINQITLPCIVFDTQKNKIATVIFFDSMPDAENVLKENGIEYIVLSEIKEVLTHPDLLRFYRE